MQKVGNRYFTLLLTDAFFLTIVKNMDEMDELNSAPSPCAFEETGVVQQAEEYQFSSSSKNGAKEVWMRPSLENGI